MTADREVRVPERPRRARILEETLRIVGERGYNGFGIQELADRCGLTKPGLLHYFGSKDQLLIALLTEVDASQEAELSALVAPIDAGASAAAQCELFRRALRTFVERSLAQPELIRLRVVLRVEAINPLHPAHAYFNDRERGTLAWLAERTATFSPNPTSTARQVMAMMAGLEEQWLREGREVDLLAEWDRALALLLPG